MSKGGQYLFIEKIVDIMGVNFCLKLTIKGGVYLGIFEPCNSKLKQQDVYATTLTTHKYWFHNSKRLRGGDEIVPIPTDNDVI